MKQISRQLIRDLKIIVFLLLVLFLFTAKPNTSSALVANFIVRPYGGKIISIIPPNPFCPFPVLVISRIGIPIRVALTPNAIIHSYGVFLPGNNTLGVASTFNLGPTCAFAFPILRIGTSIK